MALARKTKGSFRLRFKAWWQRLAALAAAAAAAGFGLSFLAAGSPVQQTIIRFLQDAMWLTAAACVVSAGAAYALRRYQARKANPYARLRLAREPRFDMPRLGPRATALAVGEPVIRIRDLPKAPRPDRWSPELLRAFEWKRFETLCAAYYGHRHFRAESLGCAPDGGSESKLYFKDLPKPVAMLTCKAWGSRPVGVKPVRELVAVMARNGVAKGIFHTGGDYTNEAKAFAREHRIQLVSGAEFVGNILQLPEAVQKALLDLTTSGDYTTPTCPSCGERMVMCSADRGDFWGCSNYPRCKATLTAVHASW